MNWAELLAPRYHLSRLPDGSPVRTARGPWSEQFLGFDRPSARLVTLHTLHPRMSLSPPLARSVAERVYLAGRISHPGLYNVLDYGEREGALFFVTEFADGEALPAYLQRLRSLPLAVSLDLAVQLVSLLRHLAHFPRILGQLHPDDLWVSLSPGVCPRLRFAGLGLHREERDGAAPSVERVWLPHAAQLLWDLVGVSIREDPQLKFYSEGTSALLDPFRGFLHLAQSPTNRSPLQAFRDLEEGLHRYLHHFHGLFAPHFQAPCPAETISLRPQSQLIRTLILEGILSHWGDHNYEFAPELFASQAPYALAARDVRTDTGVWLQVLPPDSLKGDTGLESLYLRLGNPAWKDEPALLRTFFLRAENGYTAVAEEAIHGFHLAALAERRGPFFSDEVLHLLTLATPAFDLFEAGGVPGDPLPPWQLYVSFGPSVSTGEIEECLASRRVAAWPPFRLKARFGATTVDFTRPFRSEWEEILRRLTPKPTDGPPAPSTLNLSFAALAIYLLEYRRYRGQLTTGDPRPRPLVACPRLQAILEGSLLRPQSSGPSPRTSFLDAFRSQIPALGYPHHSAEEPAPPPSPGDSTRAPQGFDPSWLESAATAFHAARQNQATLLRRLLRRQAARMRQRQEKPDQLPS